MLKCWDSINRASNTRLMVGMGNSATGDESTLLYWSIAIYKVSRLGYRQIDRVWLNVLVASQRPLGHSLPSRPAHFWLELFLLLWQTLSAIMNTHTIPPPAPYDQTAAPAAATGPQNSTMMQKANPRTDIHLSCSRRRLSILRIHEFMPTENAQMRAKTVAVKFMQSLNLATAGRAFIDSSN
jgi:hypothetical protein